MHRIAAAFALTAIALTATFVVHADENATTDNPAKVEVKPAVHTTDTVSVMPEAFTSFGACEQGGYLYLIGGHTGQAHEYDRDGFNRNFYRLSLRDRTSWEILPG